MQERINVDDTFPCGTALLVDTPNKTFLQHGGVCTRIVFDKVEQLDLAEFLRTEVPRLNKQLNKLTVIRNAAGGCYMVMLGDQVLRYSIKDVAEVPLDDFLVELQNNSEQIIAPNIPYPLVCQLIGRERDSITVLLPPTKRCYKYQSPSWDKPELFDIYTPPLWFRVSCSKAGGLLEICVAVALEQCANYRDTQLYSWPLGNVFPQGGVCMGTVTARGTNPAKAPTLRSVLGQALDMFFNSTFNDDLVDTRNCEDVLKSFYTCGNKDRYEKLLQTCSERGAHTLRVLCILSDPGGWRTLRYAKITGDAISFCLK